MRAMVTMTLAGRRFGYFDYTSAAKEVLRVIGDFFREPGVHWSGFTCSVDAVHPEEDGISETRTVRFQAKWGDRPFAGVMLLLAGPKKFQSAWLYLRTEESPLPKADFFLATSKPEGWEIVEHHTMNLA